MGNEKDLVKVYAKKVIDFLKKSTNKWMVIVGVCSFFIRKISILPFSGEYFSSNEVKQMCALAKAFGNSSGWCMVNSTLNILLIIASVFLILYYLYINLVLNKN